MTTPKSYSQYTYNEKGFEVVYDSLTQPFTLGLSQPIRDIIDYHLADKIWEGRRYSSPLYIERMNPLHALNSEEEEVFDLIFEYLHGRNNPTAIQIMEDFVAATFEFTGEASFQVNLKATIDRFTDAIKQASWGFQDWAKAVEGVAAGMSNEEDGDE